MLDVSLKEEEYDQIPCNGRRPGETWWVVEYTLENESWEESCVVEQRMTKQEPFKKVSQLFYNISLPNKDINLTSALALKRKQSNFASSFHVLACETCLQSQGSCTNGDNPWHNSYLGEPA